MWTVRTAKDGSYIFQLSNYVSGGMNKLGEASWETLREVICGDSDISSVGPMRVSHGICPKEN